jgi:hypothetical protein
MYAGLLIHALHEVADTELILVHTSTESSGRNSSDRWRAEIRKFLSQALHLVSHRPKAQGALLEILCSGLTYDASLRRPNYDN